MSEGAEFRLQPDDYCAMCGADAETSEQFVGRFLDVMVLTPEHGPAAKRLCDSCLGLVIAQVFQLLGRHGHAAVAVAAIAAQQEDRQDGSPS